VAEKRNTRGKSVKRIHGLSRTEKLLQHSVRQELKLKALTAYCYRLAIRIAALERK
jgi:hypothetical protein